MVAAVFSLFGFDLLGAARNALPATEPEPRKLNQDEDAGRADGDHDWTHSESFFWGMYPVY